MWHCPQEGQYRAILKTVSIRRIRVDTILGWKTVVHLIYFGISVKKIYHCEEHAELE